METTPSLSLSLSHTHTRSSLSLFLTLFLSLILIICFYRLFLFIFCTFYTIIISLSLSLSLCLFQYEWLNICFFLSVRLIILLFLYLAVYLSFFTSPGPLLHTCCDLNRSSSSYLNPANNATSASKNSAAYEKNSETKKYNWRKRRHLLKIFYFNEIEFENRLPEELWGPLRGSMDRPMDFLNFGRLSHLGADL